MPKFLIQASYTAEGAKGLLHEGASGRRKAIEKAVKGLGGKVESIHYAFGKYDTILIMELPDNTAATALSLAVASSGAVKITTTPLITVQEVDDACKQAVAYRPPG
jgi:uncharacterized protein with GYD domain